MSIVISELSKSFGENIVLNKFSANIPENKTTFIMGPSGCGKTTLINILMGLMREDSGAVTGLPTNKSAVFQEDRLCESFNAVSNVRLVCEKKIKDEEIYSHLAEIGLRDDLAKPVIELSGGMRRRVAVVRAILAKSDIIFMDEPFKGLDDNTKEKTMQYVADNTKNKTVIIVTHDIDEAKAIGGEIITMGLRESDRGQ
ncbi:MAG: ATP-binding cassette domain-containing protein [Acetivibrionales bacterium]|jgi:NitT/TauT family transport system ATP-binding protein|nr:ABC transporter ATP-binding protein [Clostridiaceae bacterium]